MDGRESEDKIKERVLERIDKFSFVFACFFGVDNCTI